MMKDSKITCRRRGGVVECRNDLVYMFGKPRRNIYCFISASVS